MISETMYEIIEIIEPQARSSPSPIEFEMAYQARVAIDCIRFAIKHVEQFSQPCDQIREASLQLLEALERLDARTAGFGPDVWAKVTLRKLDPPN